MFDRPAYKKMARQQLKGRMIFPMLLLVITGILLSLIAMPSRQFATEPASESMVASLYSLIAVSVWGILTVAICFVFITFTRTTEKVGFNAFFEGLERWLSGALGGLWFALWVFLWSLLFVIPGIVKAIAYSQMFFVLAEHPGVGVRRAMQVSKVITQGHKGDLFVMHLSFIGWHIVCLLSCGIGFLWLVPYMLMSYTNAYTALKNMAIATGRLNPADLAPQ